MATYAMWVVQCDHPSICPNTQDSTAINAAEARRFARQKGWIRKRMPDGKYVDLCPTHQDLTEQVALPDKL